LPGSEHEADLHLLTAAAQAAGTLALRYWKHDPAHWDKGEGAGPVSEADLAVNDLLAEQLRAARPDYGWLSEESLDGTARLSCARSFVIDPIDGTRAFLANDSGFAHALAVVENGLAVAGVVHLPALGLTYAARRGGAAMLNGQPIRPATTGQIAGSTLLAAKGVDDPAHWQAPTPGYRRSFRASLAWRLCLVAEGRFDATLSFRPVWEWDIAAASLIAECAGVTATDRHGRALRFNTAPAQCDGIIVAAPGLHAQYRAQLRPAPSNSGG
jgi:myo-inositol-1(or 4)-monophosphatase